jgi:ferrous iron transport protein B
VHSPTLNAPEPPATAAPDVVLRVALVGNPNTGKTTLFNALTGLRQRVGNFAGVTVERVEGFFRTTSGRRAACLDLPGSYSLSASSPDEQIALEVLLGRARDGWRPDVVVVVVDAAHLERNLFLASQVIELGVPVVVALNQMDAAEDKGVTIDVPELIDALGVPVVPLVAKRSEGIDALGRACEIAVTLPAPARKFTLPPTVEQALAPVVTSLEAAGFDSSAARLEALRSLSVQHLEPHVSDVPGLEDARREAAGTLAQIGLPPQRVEADARYGWIGEVIARSVQARDADARTFSDRIDAIALHRVFGPMIFVALMAIVFQSIFTWAGPLQEAIEGVIGALGERVGAFLPEGDLRSLVVDGVFAGVGGVLVFLPQICVLFLVIGILEDSGYMARAAFLMDRVMRRVGLHGRSFIPMLSGYACAVPGIMATRVIENRQDRLATMMVVPLMSCSARLPVYTLLIGTFVPASTLPLGFGLQGLTLLGMYLLGTLTALAVAAVFKRTLLKGPVRPMILELPTYRWPSPRTLGVTVWQRAMLFVKRAGTVIMALSIVLWAMATYPRTAVDPTLTEVAQAEQQLEGSLLGTVGKIIEPAVRPLGYDWKIGVSIAASFAAREVFVSTMGTIYGVGSSEEETAALGDRLRAERDPVTGEPVYTTLVAIGLMVFYVYALMCMSTTAITVREAGGGRVGWGWAAVQFGYMLALAWIAAFVVYQGGRALGLG